MKRNYNLTDLPREFAGYVIRGGNSSIIYEISRDRVEHNCLGPLANSAYE